eukprot:5208362-Pyramimonas_sp.AAC.1
MPCQNYRARVVDVSPSSVDCDSVCLPGTSARGSTRRWVDCVVVPLLVVPEDTLVGKHPPQLA